MTTDPLASYAAHVLGDVEGEDTPATGAPPATPTEQEPLTTVTVAALRAMLDEHDRGQFLRSGLLADLIRRDPDVYGALQQRLTALGALPTCFDPADESDAAKVARDELAADWPRLCPTPAQWDLWTSEILMGFAVAQVVWRWDDEHKRLRQTVEPWPCHAVEHDRTLRRWRVNTSHGLLDITPGDGQWVLFAPRSAMAPWLWGAIRPVAEWYLSNSFAASDGRRRSETTGQGIWKAKLPSGARESAEGKGFIRGLRNIGRAAVMPVPQGATPETSYDLELVEAKSDAYKIFEWLKRTGGGSIRLAILGQDLTSQNQTIGSKGTSETGENVTAAVVEAQARGWSECVNAHVVRPRSTYLGELLTTYRIDAEPEADRKAAAEASSAEAQAVADWQARGVDVDVAKHAAKAGMHMRSATITKPAAPAEKTTAA